MITRVIPSTSIPLAATSVAITTLDSPFLNFEIILELLQSHPTTLIISSHFANWELLALALENRLNGQIKIPFKPSKNPYVNKFIINYRDIKDTLITRKSVMKTILKYSKMNTNKGHAFLLLTDQSAPPSASGWNGATTIDFLNQPTKFMTEPEKIAKITKSPMIYAKMKKIKRGYFTVEFIILPNADQHFNATRHAAKILEEQIKAQPELFFWYHNRWKER